MFRFLPCLHRASRGCLPRAAPPIQPLELAWQKASSQHSDISQHSSTTFWTQAGPGYFFHTTGACLLVSNQTYSMYCDCWYGPTYTQKTEATFLPYNILTRPCAWFLSANLEVFFHFTVFSWVSGILCITLVASFSSCKFLYCNMPAEKQVCYGSLTSIFTTVILFILLFIYWERRKWEKEKQLFAGNRKTLIWMSV